jgi:hypothetical protein
MIWIISKYYKYLVHPRLLLSEALMQQYEAQKNVRFELLDPYLV